MNPHELTLRDGTRLVVYEADSGLWACPVCGTVSLSCAPWDETGFGSFEICVTCNFEFGFDDDPAASGGSPVSVADRLAEYRERVVLEPARRWPEQRMAAVVERLRAIGVEVPWSPT